MDNSKHISSSSSTSESAKEEVATKSPEIEDHGQKEETQLVYASEELGRCARELVKALDEMKGRVEIEKLATQEGLSADTTTLAARYLEKLGLVNVTWDSDLDSAVAELSETFLSDAESGPSPSHAQSSLQFLAARVGIEDAKVELQMLTEVVEVLKQVVLASVESAGVNNLYVTPEDLADAARPESPNDQVIVVRGPKSAKLSVEKLDDNKTMQLNFKSPDSESTPMSAYLLQKTGLLAIGESLTDSPESLQQNYPDNHKRESAPSLAAQSTDEQEETKCDVDDESLADIKCSKRPPLRAITEGVSPSRKKSKTLLQA
mmetsp:Transcript_10261/g.20113  ORF Transcript_10261/g.20113 Transcript_10261/m.20113 type:complete len:319 (+) Transcript_10261:471-1427(+)